MFIKFAENKENISNKNNIKNNTNNDDFVVNKSQLFNTVIKDFAAKNPNLYKYMLSGLSGALAALSEYTVNGEGNISSHLLSGLYGATLPLLGTPANNFRDITSAALMGLTAGVGYGLNDYLKSQNPWFSGGFGSKIIKNIPILSSYAVPSIKLLVGKPFSLEHLALYTSLHNLLAPTFIKIKRDLFRNSYNPGLNYDTQFFNINRGFSKFETVM